MLTIKQALDGSFSVIGEHIKMHNLNSIQVQSVLLKLNCELDTLFEVMYSFAEYGHNNAIIGLMGSFMWSTYEGVNQ